MKLFDSISSFNNSIFRGAWTGATPRHRNQYHVKSDTINYHSVLYQYGNRVFFTPKAWSQVKTQLSPRSVVDSRYRNNMIKTLDLDYLRLLDLPYRIISSWIESWIWSLEMECASKFSGALTQPKDYLWSGGERQYVLFCGKAKRMSSFLDGLRSREWICFCGHLLWPQVSSRSGKHFLVTVTLCVALP